MRRAGLVFLLGCGGSAPAPEPEVQTVDAPAVPDAAVPDAAPKCVPAKAPVAQCQAAGLDRAAGVKCCVETCGVAVVADSLRAEFVAEDGARVPAEATAEGLCWVSKPSAPLAEGAQALVFRQAPVAGAPVDIAGGWALGAGRAACFAGPKMLADDACAGFRASRSAPAIIMLHTHELLGSEQRKTKKVQRALAKRGAEVVVESATGAAQEVLSAWFSTLVPGERADLPIEQVLLGRPAALLIRWRSPEGRVGQGVAGVGVVRAGREVLWGFNGDWVEASWPQLAELLKPEVKP